MGKSNGLAFQRTVIDLARMFGWKAASFRAVRIQRKDGTFYYATPVAADGEGFPDIFAVHPINRWRLVAECKSGSGRKSRVQKQWLQWCEVAGIPAYTWRPEDLEREIIPVLRDGPGDL